MTFHPNLIEMLEHRNPWPNLNPLQIAAQQPIRAGQDCLILAPTAGGKTEAAMFPVFSNLLAERKTGLQVIYLCPAKTLLNQQHQRLAAYANELGLRVAIRHGDTPSGDRAEILSHPPELLLTTPESMEIMLAADRYKNPDLFAQTSCVIIDEIHSLAHSDRGVQLRGILARLQSRSANTLQKIGLSATVGNPKDLAKWLSARDQAAQIIQEPKNGGNAKIDLDYVGSLENAARVITALQPGKKHLIFCDSRRQTEVLAAKLRHQGVTAYLCHSSLSLEERQKTAQAFNRDRNCVIVATSAMELGLDTDDLAGVIQIGAPPDVNSLCQRMGRSGRRKGQTPHLIILTTNPQELLRATAMITLWEQNYLEPINPPAKPLNVLAQQWLARITGEKAITPSELIQWTERVYPDMATHSGAILKHMLAGEWLILNQGLLSRGPQSDKKYANIAKLCSVFTTPETRRIVADGVYLGDLPAKALPLEAKTLTFAGKPWRIKTRDEKTGTLHVEKAPKAKPIQWPGTSRPISAMVQRAIKAVEKGKTPKKGNLTLRAMTELTRIKKQKNPANKPIKSSGAQPKKFTNLLPEALRKIMKAGFM